MNRELSDLELVKKCVDERDENAWETFVQTYSAIIWAAIQKTFRIHFFPCQQDDVEDVFNAVYLALIENDFNKLRQYRGDNSCSLQTWLSVVTARMTIDFMRRDRRFLQVEPLEKETSILDFIPGSGHSPQEALEEKQTRIALGNAVNDLQRTDRLIYRLLIERGLSSEETAKLLDMTVENIYTRKNRITDKLKKSLSAL